MDNRELPGKDVESLQHMLRVLSSGDSRLIPVTPDGIYGQNTAAAVTAFQRSHDLPATGSVDLLTWETIASAYERERVNRDPAEEVRILVNPAQILRPGDRNAHAMLLQAMLMICREFCGCFSALQVTGQMDAPTVAAVRKLQALSGLPETGIMDRAAWQHLARLYTALTGSGSQK